MAPPKSTKLHHAPPRHAPKQPPPAAPIQGSILIGQPPYIPPPQPRSSTAFDNMRKMSTELPEVSKTEMYEETEGNERTDVPDNDSLSERSRRRSRDPLQKMTGSDTSSSMESLTSGDGSNYGVQGMDVRNPRLRGKFNDGES